MTALQHLSTQKMFSKHCDTISSYNTLIYLIQFILLSNRMLVQKVSQTTYFNQTQLIKHLTTNGKEKSEKPAHSGVCTVMGPPHLQCICSEGFFMFCPRSCCLPVHFNSFWPLENRKEGLSHQEINKLGSMGQWLELWTCNWEVLGSSPTHGLPYTHCLCSHTRLCREESLG